MNIRCKATTSFPGPESNQAGSILPALAISLLLHILFAGIFPALTSNTDGPEAANTTGTKLRLSLSRPHAPAASLEEAPPERLPAPSIQEIKPEKSEQIQEPSQQIPEEVLSSSSQKAAPNPVKEATPVAQKEVVTHARSEESSTTNILKTADSGDDADLSEPVSTDRIDPVQARIAELQARLNRNKIYPYQALRRNLQGEVTLKVILRPDGSLESADILSGHRTFHSPSLKALKKSLPLPPTDSNQLITVTLSLKYELE